MITYTDVAALLPTTVLVESQAVSPEFFDTVIRKKPDREYYVVDTPVRVLTGRSEGLSHGLEYQRVRMKCVGRTGASSAALADAAISALDTVRVNGVPLVLVNASGPYEDVNVTFTNGSTALWTVLEFDYMAGS